MNSVFLFGRNGHAVISQDFWISFAIDSNLGLILHLKSSFESYLVNPPKFHVWYFRFHTTFYAQLGVYTYKMCILSFSMSVDYKYDWARIRYPGFWSICDLLCMLLISNFSIFFAPEKYRYPENRISGKYVDICGYLRILTNISFLFS